MEEYGLLTYKGRVYIPNVTELRRVVIDEIHQAPYYGHPGYQKIIAIARKQYFWPGMKRDLTEYISRCIKCQQVKVVLSPKIIYFCMKDLIHAMRDMNVTNSLKAFIFDENFTSCSFRWLGRGSKHLISHRKMEDK